ncbi:alpha/beta fold hydrolase [Amycolatopsis sp. PS_44_ISF1]|uniref:alpha/beta hydrolase n=1 Tax=Amycolatopsis sp. PS_44_ISF1 TaxID=2974917 RepID=UPI0028DE0EF4|nr:alpha/beta fold hydrolase [Amycolatopsis sp. PS_44_ISF1]MDT8914966.1 lysophospholipase [Amycolatopsis sp. PS_44_ISF1]
MAEVVVWMDVESFEFDSDGTPCSAHLYRPAESSGSTACVIMAGGIGGTKDFALPEYARRFAARGLLVIAFDYRHFGGSGGAPRQLVHAARQQDDYRAALRHARTIAEVDPDRIVLWGSSLSGAHVITVAAGDPGVRAAIAQVPGFSVSVRSWLTLFRFAGAGVENGVRMLAGRAPRLRTAVGAPGEKAFIVDSEAKRLTEEFARTAPGWREEIAIAGLRALPRPPRTVRLRMPLLLCVADRDRITSPAVSRALARLLHHTELRSYPTDHLGIMTEPTLTQTLQDQFHFLERHHVIQELSGKSGE